MSAIIFVGSSILVVLQVLQGTVKQTEVFADSVQVVWFLGVRTVVPLYAIEGEAAKNQLAGLPPVREDALEIQTSEKVVFKTAKNESAVSLRLRDGKMQKVRLEPGDKEAFCAALASARSDMQLEQAHYFSNEMPTEQEEQEEILSYTPNHRVGYWLRVLPMCALYWVIVSYGFSIAIFFFKELANPGRAKQENEFRNTVLIPSYESIVFGGIVIFYGSLDYLQGLPSRVRVDFDALRVTLDRATTLGCQDIVGANPKTIIVPLSCPSSPDNVRSAGQIEDCAEKAITCLFEEPDGMVVRARRYYIVTDTKKAISIERRCCKAERASEGRVVKCGDHFTAFFPPTAQLRASFKDAVLTRCNDGL